MPYSVGAASRAGCERSLRFPAPHSITLDGFTPCRFPCTHVFRFRRPSRPRCFFWPVVSVSGPGRDTVGPRLQGFRFPRDYFVTPDQAEFLSHVSVVYLDDGQGGTVKHGAQLTGASTFAGRQRLRGQTYDTTNGLGNLIVGYNELGNPNGDNRTGSHNLVTGQQNSFSSYGGLVVGQVTTPSPDAMVLGQRRASATTASGGLVLGQRRVQQHGQRLLLLGQRRVCQHGHRQRTPRPAAGTDNDGLRATGLLGQRRIRQHGQRRVLLGQRRGRFNTAHGHLCSSVSGGRDNTA